MQLDVDNGLNICTWVNGILDGTTAHLKEDRTIDITYPGYDEPVNLAIGDYLINRGGAWMVTPASLVADSLDRVPEPEAAAE